MDKILYIIRGPSGSGKTTLARNLSAFPAELPHFEADDWFIRPNLRGDGEYIFDPTELHNAHAFCRLRTERAMRIGEWCIIVSNTSTTLKELQPYLDLAQKYGYKTGIYRTVGPWDPEVLFKRNQHNVPLETIKRQIARYEIHPNERELNGN